MKKFMAIMMVGLLMMMVATGCKEKEDGTNSGTGSVEKETYVIGLDPGFPPMGSKSENGEIVGFDIDLANAVADEMGVAFTFKEIDWDSKELEINAGNIDLIWNGFSVTEEREAQYALSKPYLKNRQIIVVDKNSSISSKGDLAGKEILLQSKSSAVDALEADPISDSVGNVTEYVSNLDCFNDMKIGRGDAIVIDEVVGKYYIETIEGGENFRILEDSLAEEYYAIAAKLGNEDLINKIEGAIDKLVESGKTKEISEKWFGDDIFYWE